MNEVSTYVFNWLIWLQLQRWKEIKTGQESDNKDVKITYSHDR